jgi:hypothetical protein
MPFWARPRSGKHRHSVLSFGAPFEARELGDECIAPPGAPPCYVVTASATRSTCATSGLHGNRINSSQPASLNAATAA